MNVEVMVGRDKLPKLMFAEWFADQVARALDGHNVTVLVVDGKGVDIQHEGKSATSAEEKALAKSVNAAIADVLARDDYPKKGEY